MGSARQCMLLGWAAASMAVLVAFSGCGGGGRAAPGPGKGAGADGPSRAPTTAVSGRYIVVLKEGARPAEVARDHGVVPDAVYHAALNGFSCSASAAQAAVLQGDDRVRSLEPDRRVSLVLPTGHPVTRQLLAGEPLPTGADRIDAERNVRTDVSRPADPCIAIIDTGIFGHTLLNVVGGRSFVPGTFSPADDNGHGTHVAGIAAARAAGSGFRGVAPGARLVAAKVLDAAGSGELSWVVSGVDWVTSTSAQFNTRVANMSLSAAGGSPALEAAIDGSVAAGITFVVAAGNEAADAGLFNPGSFASVICVSAMADSDGRPGCTGLVTFFGIDDTFAAFSNFGRTVDIAAPGVDIRSTWLSDGFATLSGTSMASPHVAGAAALFVAAHPGATPAQVARALTTTHGEIQAGPLGFAGDPDAFAEPLVYARGL